jgi:hypothetical protein
MFKERTISKELGGLEQTILVYRLFKIHPVNGGPMG